MSSSSPSEAARLSALWRCRILDTDEEEPFAQYARLAARLCTCPLATIGFVDRERVWLKAAHGLPREALPRRGSPCDAALAERCFQIEDAARDPRFAAHPLIAGDPHGRGYAAARLHSPEGEAIGVLAVLDTEPRSWQEGELSALCALAETVSAQIELRLLRDPRLLKSEAMLRAAQRITGIGSWQWDMRTNEISWSDEMYALFQQPRGQAPTLETFMERVHPDDRAMVQERIAGILEGESVRYPEYRIQLPDKSVRIVGAIVELERDLEGKPMRLTGGLQDVTAQRRNELERQQLAVQMSRAQKLESLGLVAAGIAHDFNNLLVWLLGNAELALTDVGLSESTREFVDRVIAAGSQAAALTHQLLAYTGRGPVSMCRVDLDQHVRDLSTLLRASLPKTVRVATQLAPNLPEIWADPDQLRQVTMNLILNAAESYLGREGELRVRTLVEEVAAPCAHGFTAPGALRPGRYVIFEVSDDGCGMNPETLERIFEPFFTTKFTGRGLGLAAVLGIVRGHGAQLSVDSAPDVGTTLRVYFAPLAPVAAEAGGASADEKT